MIKQLSDTPKTYQFTYKCQNAQEISNALIGYMIGTYDQSAIEITYIGNGNLKAEYTSDEDLTESFERITKSLDHTDDYEDYEDDFEEDELTIKSDLNTYTALIGSFNTLGEAQAFTENLDDDLTNGNNFIYEQTPDTVALYVSPQDTIANSTIQKLEEAYVKHEGEYEPDTFRLSYHDMRVQQLQSLDKDTLINDTINYELELLDYTDRLLSDEPLPLDSLHGYETIELLGDEVIDLVKELDTNKKFDGIHDYIIGE
ncbi:hypothetical protein HMPREF9318_01570 [Streptococcus urinalis FB127-CNA-2]|uniref:Uncharacterized protein n=1 Tax=Streptococcus urinalis 2285-97 TaxID=764291 RepID=G5KFL1_9STRE|nr:hypothetical protein [Streptococcus urinalis]QBX12166.1 hypothetical protein JavanS644_0002 [Streptococcus satellite phage Javan644]QBX12194.1 hypothetical protein JavanS647_0002 [Streptococcus satellite phage Javan647]QBX12217.1 hypothetical protein JavanS649_0012 [Streptococcus satellite phage Javan649]EHJ56921.1 hypothetical protein STRUR_2278 [Streptococcus urinalis 2285-97]EKS19174.1 hypothetical protein HMPREF9318_01570 [Streptococcus urinalis FB127-CNA-2]